ncbi:hypothetical protein PGB90_003889 [Kerria lacca]
MSDYEAVTKSRLKLKREDPIKKKKKKSKNKDKKFLDQVNKSVDQNMGEKSELMLTKAEKAFMQQQEKLQKERIMKIASMTHKQRVEEFNRHLDSLTEHFDIPKVSWTK